MKKFFKIIRAIFSWKAIALWFFALCFLSFVIDIDVDDSSIYLTNALVAVVLSRMDDWEQ